MPRRIEQLNSLLRREISAIILRDVEFPLGSMVTIVAFATTHDLQSATASVSIFPDRKRGEILAILKKQTPHILFLLRKRLSLHHIPPLMWKVDTTEQKAEDIETLLDSLKEAR